MQAMAFVVGIGTITLVAAAVIVAPRLFHEHLLRSGAADDAVRVHAEEAFTSAIAISVTLGTITSLLAAAAISWSIIRRVSRPVEELATSAEIVATGRYDIEVPAAVFSSELNRLSTAFNSMAHRLAETESRRTRLIADLAHELRTPLATLEAYIDGMEDEVLPHDSASWSTMRDQVDRLRRLATDVREVAAAEEHALGLELAATDVRAVAAAAVAAAAPRFRSKRVELALHEPASACLAECDALRLQQVLANVLDNALRHTPADGRVDVTVRTTGATLRVEVQDTGEGIPTGEHESVFERFHRVDPSRRSTDGSGSGLGLTIARAIVADHGGTMSAASPGPGAGTTITIELPLLRTS